MGALLRVLRFGSLSFFTNVNGHETKMETLIEDGTCTDRSQNVCNLVFTDSTVIFHYISSYFRIFRSEFVIDEVAVDISVLVLGVLNVGAGFLIVT